MSRSTFRTAPLVAALFATAGGIATADCFEAAGPRQPVAAVERTVDGRFDVAVSILAVTSFNEAKNGLENRRLARRLAEWGLWRELGAPTNRILSVSGLSPVSFIVVDGRVEAEFSLPTNGVSWVTPATNDLESVATCFPLPLDAEGCTEEVSFSDGFASIPVSETNGDVHVLPTSFDADIGIDQPTNFIAPLFPIP